MSCPPTFPERDAHNHRDIRLDWGTGSRVQGFPRHDSMYLQRPSAQPPPKDYPPRQRPTPEPPSMSPHHEDRSLNSPNRGSLSISAQRPHDHLDANLLLQSTTLHNRGKRIPLLTPTE